MLYPVSVSYDTLTPAQVLNGYANGIFPMGEEDGTITWFSAGPRTVIPLYNPDYSLNIPRSLKQVINKNLFEIRIDTRFNQVIECCSMREPTWINNLIKETYLKLHSLGYAHSVEAWAEGKLCGGLYGVALQGAFFGESMFHLAPNASKAAVVKLYEILRKNEYYLFDIQMKTSVFEIFRAVDISQKKYLEKLSTAMEMKRRFLA